MMLGRTLPEGERQLLMRWMKGHPAAIEMVAQVLAITHVWDDLVDRDRKVEDHEITWAFHLALIELPRNPFWRTHQDELRIVLEHGIFDWVTGNVFEKRKELHVSYVLRGSVASLVIRAARIIGGPAWAMMVSEELRNHIFDDYQSYVSEHGAK